MSNTGNKILDGTQFTNVSIELDYNGLGGNIEIADTVYTDNILEYNLNTGVSIEGSIFQSGTVIITSTQPGINKTTASLVVNGGTVIYSDSLLYGINNFLNTSNSINLTSGSVIINGGISIQKNLNIGGITTLFNTTISDNSNIGSVLLYGGLSINNTTDSSSFTQGGNLTIAGGVSIAKTLYSNVLNSNTIFITNANLLNSNMINQTTTNLLASNITTNTLNVINSTITNSYIINSYINFNTVSNSYIINDNVMYSNITFSSIANLEVSNSNIFSFNSTSGNIVNLTVANLNVTNEISYTEVITNSSTANFINTFSTINSLQLTNGTFGSLYGSNIFSTNSTFGSQIIIGTTDSINSTTGTVILNYGGLSINNTSNSTSFTSGGALSLAGGLAVGKNVYIGGFLDINYNNIFNITSPSLDYNNTVASIGLVAANKWYVDTRFNQFTIGNISSNISGNITAGQVVVGITGGNITTYSTFTFDGNLLTLNSTIDSTSLTNGGTLQVYGGASIDKQLFVGGNTHILGYLDMNNQTIMSISTPTMPYDASNKYYVDNTIANGFTTSNIYVSGTISANSSIITNSTLTNLLVINETISNLLSTNSTLTNVLISGNNNNSASNILFIDANNSQTFPGEIIFKNTAGKGDFKIISDGGDIRWKGGGGRALQMGAYHEIRILGGGTTSNIPFINGSSSTYNTIIQNSNNSIALTIQSNTTQTVDLTQWTNNSGAVLTRIDNIGNLQITSSADSITSFTGGSITTLGGMSIGKSVKIGSTINSINNSTGALVIAGGLGVNKNVYFGSSLDMNGQLITNVTSPTNMLDVANKYYVDSQIIGNINLVAVNITSGTISATSSTITNSVFTNLSSGTISATGSTITNITSNSIYSNILGLPSILTPSTSGTVLYYTDSADNKLKSISSTGNIQVYQPTTSLGDIPINNGLTLDRLSVGISGQILMSDANAPLNLSWQNLLSGGGNNITTYTDLYIRYMDIYNSTNMSIISNTNGSTWTTVKFGTIRRLDSSTFIYNTNGNITLNEIGNYFITSKLTCLRSDTGPHQPGAQIQLRMLLNGSEYPGTRSYSYIPAIGNTNGNTISLISILDITNTIGNTITIQCNEITGNSNVSYSIGTTLQGMKIISNSPSTDTSQFLNSYDNVGGLSLSTSYTDIPFSTDLIINPIYTHSTSNTAIFTVNSTAAYFIYGKVSIINTVGSVNSSDSDLILVSSTGGSYSTVSGFHSFMNIKSDTFNSIQSNTVFGIVVLYSGNTVKLQSSLLYGSENGTTVINGSSFAMGLISNSVNGEGYDHYTTNYNSTSITIGNTYTPIPTNIFYSSNSAYFSQYSSSEVLINTSATYFITYKLTCQINSASNLLVNYKIYVNSGSGYNVIDGTYSTVSATSNISNIIYQSGIISCILYLNPGDTIQLRADNYSTQTNAVFTTINSCNCLLFTFEKTILPITSGLITYGTQWQYFTFPGPYSTTNTTLISVVSTNTSNIPDGTYKLSFYYEAYTSNKPGLILILFDNIVYNTFYELNSRTPSWKIGSTTYNAAYQKSGFIILKITTGIHTILMKYASKSATITIQNIYFELIRIK